ncbi:adenosylcobinamide amidohydrolase [Bacillus horti]|uniref:Iron complex transport system ATP-binding protein n=1 Tax=Caldalkalibacillus horti TaxID=77523 RepID=A0ABT9VU01_9BACI|nr:adenosylcobinamide amidohydrolase [Bacillus horti]MDQ0164457.1 iron complex transport system ATP-binding protein [Bacillus horti]
MTDSKRLPYTKEQHGKVGSPLSSPVSPSMNAVLQLNQLSGGYDDQLVVKEISFEVLEGEFLSLIGPNGSGKSTVLKLVTGLLPIHSGEVHLFGRPLSSYSTVEKARVISVLSQEEQVSFDFTVEEIVQLGRYPFQRGWFQTYTKKDQKQVDEVMELTNVAAFRDIPFRLLSGGEKQRVLLAKALVQEPKLLFLDEPTNHLDIHHSYELLQVLKEWQKTRKLTVLAILHDLNLAALYSDRIVLLDAGTVKEMGEPNLLKNSKQLEEVYQVQVQATTHPDVAKPQVYLSTQNHISKQEKALVEMYSIQQVEELLHIKLDQPFRTISNAVWGEGIQWAQDYCNFYVTKDYVCSDPQEDVSSWMMEKGILPNQAIGMMTAVPLKHAVHCTRSFHGVSFAAVVTAGVGNPVDIIGDTEPQQVRRAGTINVFVFVDAHLSDGALVNASLSATEAKTKALAAHQIKDKQTGTLATGTATDSLCIASSQRGERTAYAGSGTIIGKGIAQVVYEATYQAIERYLKGNR